MLAVRASEVNARGAVGGTNMTNLKAQRQVLIEHDGHATVVRVTYPDELRRRDRTAMVVTCTAMTLAPLVTWWLFRRSDAGLAIAAVLIIAWLWGVPTT